MNTSLKRILSIAMALLLALSCFSFASAESEKIFVDPAIMNEADMTIAEWTATAEIRVLYVVSAVVDCVGSWTEDDVDLVSEAITLDSIYIACDDELIYLLAFAENSYMMYTYFPEMGLAFYSITESEGASEYSAMALEALLEEGHYSAYYQVDGQAILDQMTALLED